MEDTVYHSDVECHNCGTKVHVDDGKIICPECGVIHKPGDLIKGIIESENFDAEELETLIREKW